mgnify:CR=1 FL=1
MWSNNVSLDIHAPPEKIFAYLIDFSRHAEWSSNVKEIKLVRGKLGEVGAKYEALENIPRPMTTYARIIEVRPPPLRQSQSGALIGWEATDYRVFRTQWRLRIQPRYDVDAVVSHVSMRVTFYPLNFFANLILYLFRVPRVEHENRASLMKIKEIVERQT